jgi:hypothetical protein
MAARLCLRRVGVAVVAVVAAGGLFGVGTAIAAPPSWSNVTPTSGTSPTPRIGAAMVYDPATKDVVLFGGYDGSSVLGDTWVWNGSTWSKLTPSAAPSARESAAMVFDQASGQLLLFGGIVPVANAPSTFFNDTWVWTGATWQQLQPASSPPARGFASIAYDATSKNVVLFGGASQGSYLGDTWTWDGSTWAEASQTGLVLVMLPRWRPTRPLGTSSCSAGTPMARPTSGSLIPGRGMARAGPSAAPR